METMYKSAPAPKGVNWIKIAGIAALVGILFAVGRLVFRALREEPPVVDDDDDEHHEAA